MKVVNGLRLGFTISVSMPGGSNGGLAELEALSMCSRVQGHAEFQFRLVSMGCGADQVRRSPAVGP
eukprot:scaffold110482_cov38-Tisochrysis_lutea.AAC.1